MDVLDLKRLVFLIWQMREFDKLPMKESYNSQQFNIYWILGNFLEKVILRKLYTLKFKSLLWDFSLLAWGYGQVMVKSLKLQQRYIWPSVIWWPHQYGWPVCKTEADSKCYLRKRKVTSNFIFKFQGGLLVEVSFFHNIIEL